MWYVVHVSLRYLMFNIDRNENVTINIDRNENFENFKYFGNDKRKIF